MSAPLKLTPTQMVEVSQALEVLNDMRSEQGVVIGDTSGIMAITHVAAGVSLEIAWSDEDETFVISDRVGS